MLEIFLLNRAIYKIMWKNMAQPDRSQVTMQYGSCILHDGQLKLEIHTENT